jgi:hypothetical protein
MPLTYQTDMAPIVPIHQNLAVAVGAAKDQTRALLEQFERQGDARTARSSAVYLALVVMHERLLAADPPPVAHFIPDLEQLSRSCSTKLASVQPLIEAALAVARGRPDEPDEP